LLNSAHYLHKYFCFYKYFQGGPQRQDPVGVGAECYP